MPRMLLARAFAGFVFLFAVIAVVLFGAAGTLDYPQAWAMLVVFFGSAGIITVWLWFRDKALLERRVKAGPGSEPDPMQSVVQALASIVFLGTFVVPGLDRRFGWSHVPLAASVAGDALVALGFLIVFLTFRANTFTAGTIELAEGQASGRQRPLRGRAPSDVRRRAHHVRRHPAGARLLVGLAAGRRDRARAGLAADARGGFPDRQPRRLRRLSRPGALPARTGPLVT
jgi:hypothetical protein